MGYIWAVVIAGAVLLVLVQFLPDKENAQKLAHFFVAIALVVALLMGFKDFRKDKEDQRLICGTSASLPSRTPVGIHYS